MRLSGIAHFIFSSVAILALAPNEARSQIFCQVMVPTSIVRTIPDGGDIISHVEVQRIVFLSNIKKDTKGRAWAKIVREEWDYDYDENLVLGGWMLRDHLKCLNIDSLKRERLSVKVLRAAGIAPQEASLGFDISCEAEVPNGWGVTISDELYSSYQSRGFSKTALCFALGSGDVFFDPETGRQLKLYTVGQDPMTHPIWVPNCFKKVEILKKLGHHNSWRPSGCVLRYHPTTGLPIDDAKVVELWAGGAAGPGVDEDNISSTVSADRLRSLVTGK
jgi:hypothetical protein